MMTTVEKSSDFNGRPKIDIVVNGDDVFAMLVPVWHCILHGPR